MTEAERVGFEASVRWGPFIQSALWHLKHEFPALTNWGVSGGKDGTCAAFVSRSPEGGGYWASGITPEWALCLAIEKAARAGEYRAVPPLPPARPAPQPES